MNGMTIMFSGHEPLEYVWDMVGKRVAVEYYPPTHIQFLQELKRAFLEDWDKISEILIN